MLPSEIDELFERLQDMPQARPGEKLREMPPGKVITGTAFFPGGTGLWNAPTNQRMPTRGVMVMGNTFDTQEGFNGSLAKGHEVVVSAGGQTDLASASPTWKGLLGLLQGAGIKLTDCWFTNAYPGLIENPGSSSNTGSANIRPGGELEQFCQGFFLHTVKLMQPQLLLALGREPIQFIGRLAKIPSWQKTQTFSGIDDDGKACIDVNLAGMRMTAVALLHPSMRAGNMWRRHLPNTVNGDAEVVLLRCHHSPTALKITTSVNQP